jgi:acyl carrier protein
MEFEKFRENFAEAVDLDISEITNDLDFKNHPKWDSMAVLSVIAMVDEYYSKVLTGDEIEASKTIKDLFNVLTK